MCQRGRPSTCTTKKGALFCHTGKERAYRLVGPFVVC
jgi:hypothetical protein